MYVPLQVNSKPTKVTTSFEGLKLCGTSVVISRYPVRLLYDAVVIPIAFPIVGIPTISAMDFPAPITGCTTAPCKGATPNPPVDPRETIIPPLGN